MASKTYTTEFFSDPHGAQAAIKATEAKAKADLGPKAVGTTSTTTSFPVQPAKEGDPLTFKFQCTVTYSDGK